MTISTLVHYEAALKQRVLFRKTGTSVAANAWFSAALGGGSPPAISTVSSTVSGVVPVSGDTGHPLLDPFSTVGYLTAVEASVTNEQRVTLYDRLFHCGGYPQNAASQTLSGQPSFSGRVPGGTDYTGTLLYLELLALFTTPSSYTVTITYTDQSGNTGHSTSVTIPSTGGTTGLNRAYPIPLASGDSGISKIESVSGSAGPAGNFNLFIARPLWTGAIDAVPYLRTESIESLGMREIYPTSALTLMSATSSSGVSIASEINFEIASY